MAGYKINRIESDVRLAMSEILRDIKDPRISKMLSIVKVSVSSDLSYATFYVSAVEGEEATAESVKILNKTAGGYIRRELSNRVKLRKTPEIRFVADDSIAFGAHISRIIDSFAESGEKNENE